MNKNEISKEELSTYLNLDGKNIIQKYESAFALSLINGTTDLKIIKKILDKYIKIKKILELK